MKKCGKFVKLIGFKFDAVEGIDIVVDKNVKDYIEAGTHAEERRDEDIIFIGIPCEYSLY